MLSSLLALCSHKGGEQHPFKAGSEALRPTTHRCLDTLIVSPHLQLLSSFSLKTTPKMWLLDSVRTMWPAIMDLRISIHWINAHPGNLAHCVACIHNAASMCLPADMSFLWGQTWGYALGRLRISLGHTTPGMFIFLCVLTDFLSQVPGIFVATQSLPQSGDSWLQFVVSW